MMIQIKLHGAGWNGLGLSFGAGTRELNRKYHHNFEMSLEGQHVMQRYSHNRDLNV